MNDQDADGIYTDANGNNITDSAGRRIKYVNVEANTRLSPGYCYIIVPAIDFIWDTQVCGYNWSALCSIAAS